MILEPAVNSIRHSIRMEMSQLDILYKKNEHLRHPYIIILKTITSIHQLQIEYIILVCICMQISIRLKVLCFEIVQPKFGSLQSLKVSQLGPQRISGDGASFSA